MAKQNLGKIIMTPKGVYNNSTAYEFLDVVTYNGSSYVCKQASTGNLPTTDYWQQLAYKGDKPVVGVDYFTENDKKEIADSVIESSSEDIDDLYNAMLSNTASGTEINVTDSINCRCIETKFNGMSIQDGEPSPTTPVEIVSLGYENLLDISKITENLWINASGDTGSSTTTNTSDYIKVEKDKTYCFSYKYTTLLGENARGISLYDENKNIISGGTNYLPTNKGFTITPVQNGYIRFSFDKNCYNIQLEKGSTAHAYVPYGKYGVGVKTVGKNLAKPRDITGNGYNGITGITNADGSFTISGTCTGDMGINLMSLTTAPILLENGKSYTQKLFLISGSGDFKIVPYVLNLDGTTTYNYFTSTIESPTFTRKVDGDKTVTGYQFYCLKGATVNVTFKVQLEEGTVATDYVPYQENISVIPLNEPLRSLPNGVKDIAHLKNNKLYVDRYVGSVVLNGSESWTRGVVDSQYYFYADLSNSVNAKSVSIQLFSNYFKGDTSNTENGFYHYGNNVIIFNHGITNTLSEFKTWLSTNNTQVDYELATPVTEYLGTIKDLPRTFEGGCNITADSNIDNVELEIKYAQDIKAYINNLIK